MRLIVVGIALIMMSLGISITEGNPGHKKAPPPPPKHGGNHPQPKGHLPVHSPHNYHVRHGHVFKYGYYYNGWDHHHWDHHYWDERYGCYLYHDPGLNVYYYWCAPHYRFYPIVYVPVGLGYIYPYDPNPQPPATPPPDPPKN